MSYIRPQPNQRDKSDKELAQIVWDYMRYEQPLEKADVIIGLGTHDIQTAEHCARLWEDGWAPTIVFCGGRGRLTEDLQGNEADVFADVAIRLGVPDGAIVRETHSTNTGENIINTYEILKSISKLPTKVILVTKPYMLRRAYATFMKQWPGKNMPTVLCSAINKELEHYGNGFETIEYTTEIMVGDLQRIHEYPKRGFQASQEIPSEVWSAYNELVRRGYTKHLLSN